MKLGKKEIVRKFIPLSFALILFAALAVGGTKAYMLAKIQQKPNTFTKGAANIEVSEPGGETYTIDEKNRIAKEVYVTNDNTSTTNAIPVYVRVRLVPIMRNESGEGTGEPVTVSYPDLNTSKWEKHGDYYYYKGVLQPGKTTEDLIKTAEIPNGIPTGKKVEIQVIADSIQTVGNASKEAWHMAFAGGGWHTAD